jgi:raffinose/stachyose/melibiose transport system substrate-binding protein
VPLFMPSMTYQGKIYGAPEGVYMILLHYNKKIFDQYGLTPPKTWDEMLKLCETFKSKNVTPIIVTGQVDYYVGMWSDYLFQRYVGTDTMMEYLYGTKGTKLAGNPDALKALQEMQKLPPYLINGWQGIDFTTSQVYFFQDKAAMILMGSWLMAEMKETIPPGFQLAVAAFPSVSGGKGKQDSVFGSAFGWSVATKSKEPDLAIEYLKRFTSNTMAQRRTTELGVLSTNKAVPAPPGIIGAEKVTADAANAQLIVYHWGTINAKFGLQSGWYDPILKLWDGKLTPDQALAALDTNIEGVRAQRASAGK